MLRFSPIQSGSVGDLYSKLSLFKSDINVRIIIFYCNGCISYEILILRFKPMRSVIYKKNKEQGLRSASCKQTFALILYFDFIYIFSYLFLF